MMEARRERIGRYVVLAELGRVSMAVETVPEPATMALIGSGLVIGARRIRRRQSR